MCSWCVTSSEEGRCGTRLGYRWTGGREEVYKEEREWMTSEPDSVYIEHRRSISLASWHTRVGAAATSTSPESQATRWHFVLSVTILKPLFPRLKVTKGPSCTLSVIGAPSEITRPFMFRPIGYGSVTLSRLVLGHQQPKHCIL